MVAVRMGDLSVIYIGYVYQSTCHTVERLVYAQNLGGDREGRSSLQNDSHIVLAWWAAGLLKASRIFSLHLTRRDTYRLST
jgi:hypothetical protein